MEQRDVVAPAAGVERVERRALLDFHSRAAPHHDAAAETQRAKAHVGNAGIAPDLSELLGRRQSTDARAEEAADLVPPRRDRTAGERQGESNIELPEQAPEWSGRDSELERRDRPPAARDARKLAHGRAGIVDVAEQVRERQRVELTVLEWQLLGIPVDEANSLCEPARSTR